ncbi:tyrosine-type recombinase/integrase [Nitrosopumilus sp.]|uniref:tyrosine-type recombinase/integrase n=1 Tax=Nitrosopumilus sp. TaxID=2024843 RepID=UPI003B593932
MKRNSMQVQEGFSDEEWLDRLYRKSESENTRMLAGVSLTAFERFCKDQGTTKEELINRFQEWMNQPKPDVRSVCMVLDKFINFLTKDHPEIKIKETGFYKAKSPSTIKNYFIFMKSYLRICHGIRITTDDIHDYIQFPKARKEPRKPLTLKTLKLLFGKCSPERRALYYVLISSGMRVSEALSLKKSNFHLNENPVRITILADDTKTKEGRETYISSEAFERLKPILDSKIDEIVRICKLDNASKTSELDKLLSQLEKSSSYTESATLAPKLKKYGFTESQLRRLAYSVLSNPQVAYSWVADGVINEIIGEYLDKVDHAFRMELEKFHDPSHPSYSYYEPWLIFHSKLHLSE